MAWFADKERRVELLESHGLPVIFTGARIEDNGFFALYLQADEALLPRGHASRGWELHVSLGYRSDYPEGTAEILRDHINGVWANRYHVLIVEWIGQGGAAMIDAEDPIVQDLLIQVAHVLGYYGNGRHTAPRQLHVSL